MTQAVLRENLYIMGGHLANDLCHGSLPAILAFMYQEGRLSSYADVAFLIMANTLVNAIIQPLAGYLADNRPRPYLMILGMCMSALGIMFIGLMDSYTAVLLLAAFNGVGLALFHPAAGKLSNIFAGERKGRGMSIFSFGGNVGFAVGPVYFTLCHLFWGLSATLALCLPALVMLVLFAGKYSLYLRVSVEDNLRVRDVRTAREGKENYRGMGVVILLIFARSAAWFGLVSFLPLYFMHVQGLADNQAAMMNGLVAVCGSLATLIGGFFSDRLGYIRLIRIASLLSIPCLAGFCCAPDTLTAVVCLMPFAMLFFAGMSPLVVVGQKYLCLHVGLATGITVGLGISFGGLIAPLLGHIGDERGLGFTMLVILGIITLAALISFLLPRIRESRQAAA